MNSPQVISPPSVIGGDVGLPKISPPDIFGADNFVDRLRTRAVENASHKSEEQHTQFSIRLTPILVAKLDSVSRACSMSRNQLIIELLQGALSGVVQSFPNDLKEQIQKEVLSGLHSKR